MGLLLAELAVTALFVGLGVLFSKGKGAFLIAGYNTMSKEKKARYDKNALCRFMGKLMFALAACWVPVALGTALGLGWLYGAGIAAYLLVIGGGLIYRKRRTAVERSVRGNYEEKTKAPDSCESAGGCLSGDVPSDPIFRSHDLSGLGGGHGAVCGKPV